MEIIYEDSDLLVVNKPPGMVVNRAQTIKEPTVQDWFDQYVSSQGSESKKQQESLKESQQAKGQSQNLQPQEWQSLVPKHFSPEYGSPEETFVQRSGLVHRLDRETSGALLLAKNPGSLLNLLDQFKQRSVQKRYLCLTHGKFELEEGEIDLPLARRGRNRKLFGVASDGRPSLTRYQVVSYFPGLDLEAISNVASNTVQDASIGSSEIKRFSQLYQGFSLVRCWPKTGRTHQIRVHLTHLQHPLVADPQYAGKKRFKLDRLWCPRQFLHAEWLEFSHPRTGEKLVVTAPLPEDLKAVLSLLPTNDVLV
jgi:23S rRNA pseudouridine1911/1915/1917 synthase